jgi:hypothetical protein
LSVLVWPIYDFFNFPSWNWNRILCSQSGVFSDGGCEWVEEEFEQKIKHGENDEMEFSFVVECDGQIVLGNRETRKPMCYRSTVTSFEFQRMVSFGFLAREKMAGFERFPCEGVKKEWHFMHLGPLQVFVGRLGQRRYQYSKGWSQKKSSETSVSTESSSRHDSTVFPGSLK